MSARRNASVLVLATAVLTGCGGGAPASIIVPPADAVGSIGRALTPADAQSAREYLDLQFAVDAWLAERCPYFTVYEVSEQRLDQSIFADPESLATVGLGLGAPTPGVAVMSEEQLDPAEFDLDGDIDTITGDEAAAIGTEVERCPRATFAESVEAGAITDRWFVEVVLPLVESAAALDRERAVLGCLHDREFAWLRPDVGRLAEVFVSVDEHLAAAGAENFEEIAGAIDRDVGEALADCATGYYDWLHDELRSARTPFLDGVRAAVSAFSDEAAQRDISP